jgi:hypothetical protein
MLTGGRMMNTLRKIAEETASVRVLAVQEVLERDQGREQLILLAHRARD